MSDKPNQGMITAKMVEKQIAGLKRQPLGDSKKVYVDHYKEGDYSNLANEVSKNVPKGEDNGFSEITARMGPYYCDEEDLKALKLLSSEEQPITINLPIKPTRWQKFVAWVKGFLRFK